MKKDFPAWIVLTVIALVAGMLLGMTNDITAVKIAEVNAAAAEAARRSVLPAAETFEQMDVAAGAAVKECYIGHGGGAVVGHTALVAVTGYGGEIEVTVGVDAAGTITGISVGGGGFSETPGLGAKTKDAAFTDQFAGKVAPLVLKQDVDSVTGASISSGAVTDGVNAACEYMAGLQ